MVSPRTQHTRGRLLAAFAVVGIVAAMLLAVTPTSSDAAQFDVTNTNDSGGGSLRQAVADAAASAGDDDVVVAPGLGTITVASEILYGATALGAINILGNGATVATSIGGVALNNQSNSLMTIDGLNLTRSPAGFILVNTGDGPMTIRNATISGGGVNTGNGALAVINSTVTGSTEFGIRNGNGTLNVTGTTITGNAEQGITTGSGSLTVVNSTITGNGQEGIRAGAGSVTLVYSTVTANTATAGGANVDAASFQSFASVLAQPQGGPNCGDTGTSNGFNFSDDASCGFTQSTDREDAGDPGLGALADNGGPTQTRLPQAGSPLLDAIPAESCQADGASDVTTDQRGVVRPQGSGCDVGSVEVEVPGPPAPGPPSPAPSAAVPVPAVARFTG